MGEGQRDGGRCSAFAPAVVPWTGGINQVFASSTNPTVATGDGLALGLRAGAEVADIEFVQFHLTVLRARVCESRSTTVDFRGIARRGCSAARRSQGSDSWWPTSDGWVGSPRCGH